MKKLTKPIITILIGLSLFSCDPPEVFQNHFYQRTFKNNASKEIKLVYHSLGSDGSGMGNIERIDTLTLAALTKKPKHFENNISSGVAKEGNIDLIIKRNIDNFNIFYEGEKKKFELYEGGQLKKEWKGPTGSFGEEINSPYNYDSWQIVKYKQVISDGNNFIYGELIFTITDKDIGE